MFEPKATASHLDSTLFRHGGGVERCPLLEANRKHLLLASISHFDPSETSSLIDIRAGLGAISRSPPVAKC
jgi:hypothetical protein